jgi:hypothetical protein
MKPIQKSLLAVAVAGIAAGIPVTIIRHPLNPAWTLALPIGVVSLGMLLISWLMRKEVARFDEEHRSTAESGMRLTRKKGNERRPDSAAPSSARRAAETHAA